MRLINDKQTREKEALCSAVIPACSGESGPDVLWVTPGGSGDFGGHAGVALCAPHGTQLCSPSRNPSPLTLCDPLVPRSVGMSGDWLPRSLFHFLSLQFSLTASRVSRRLPARALKGFSQLSRKSLQLKYELWMDLRLTVNQ